MVLDLYLIWEGMTEEEKKKQQEIRGCHGERGHLLSHVTHQGFRKWCQIYLQKEGFKYIFNFDTQKAKHLETTEKHDIYEFKPDWKDALEKCNNLLETAKKLKENGLFIFRLKPPSMDVSFYPTMFEAMGRIEKEDQGVSDILEGDGIWDTKLGSIFFPENLNENLNENENEKENEKENLKENLKENEKKIQIYPQVLNTFWIRSPNPIDKNEDDVLEPCLLLRSHNPHSNPHLERFETLLEAQKFIDLGIKKDATIIWRKMIQKSN
ncbi:hypothetical protein M0811_00790 [Anaeramoeba ignava]|uniref:Uncharacterized protein n=1 Tax=Anaeramoeba ignava TaxID=1746090 RepID=A0A9Q0LJP8_ANAIG|nr:hypothetical protein M0811_00790 [Anaeramoeba ignava]